MYNKKQKTFTRLVNDMKKFTTSESIKKTLFDLHIQKFVTAKVAIRVMEHYTNKETALELALMMIEGMESK